MIVDFESLNKLIFQYLVNKINQIMARRRSNTIRNRFEDEEIQTTTPEVEDCDSQQTVKIILRRTNKISRVLEVPFLLHLHKLQKIVKKEFFIS